MKTKKLIELVFETLGCVKSCVVQRKIVVLHSGIRFGYYAFTLKNCDRD